MSDICILGKLEIKKLNGLIHGSNSESLAQTIMPGSRNAPDNADALIDPTPHTNRRTEWGGGYPPGRKPKA